jgi:peptide-methionine (S)-S-oxide reductase
MSRSILGLLFLLPGIAASQASASRPTQQAVFAGGCFWGVDAVFKHVRGVVSVVSGYAGGQAATADYETVSTGTTGHAESVEVTFDPTQISYDKLLEIFFTVAHDPTELNRQGPDVGTQYRSAIFYRDEGQRHSALTAIAQMIQAHAFPAPIVTEVARLGHFYPAESYHQDYLAHHRTQPYIVYNDLPKLDRLKERFPELYRS